MIGPAGFVVMDSQSGNVEVPAPDLRVFQAYMQLMKWRDLAEDVRRYVLDEQVKNIVYGYSHRAPVAEHFDRLVIDLFFGGEGSGAGQSTDQAQVAPFQQVLGMFQQQMQQMLQGVQQNTQGAQGGNQAQPQSGGEMA